MMGLDFAKIVVDYLKREKYPVKEINIIAANPAMSKHLPVAITRILGYTVDFVNLRSGRGEIVCETNDDENFVPYVECFDHKNMFDNFLCAEFRHSERRRATT